jgi:hypothetical protein
LGPAKNEDGESENDTMYRKLRELEQQLLDSSDNIESEYGTSIENSLQFKSQISIEASIVSK